jgi:hypothetical protein
MTPPPNLPYPVEKASLVAIVVATAFLAVLVSRAAVSTPFEDEFYFGPLYQAALSGRLPALIDILRPHYGHIYIVLNLALWAIVYFHLPLAVLIWLQIPLLAGAALLLVVFLRREVDASLAVCIAALLLVLSPNQWEDLYWAMEISVALLLFFTMFAIERSSRFARSGEPRHAVQAMLCGFLAACSHGAGMASAVLLIPALLIHSRTARLWVLAAVYAAALGALYLTTHAFLPGSDSSPASPDALSALVRRLPRYWLVYFGSVAFPAETFSSAALRTCGGVVFAACLTWVLWRAPKRLLLPRNESYLLMLGAAIAVTIGFARLSGGVYQPDAPRYFPFASVAWIGLLCLASRTGHDGSWPRNLLVAMILFGYFTGGWREFHAAPYRKANLRSNHAALCQMRSEGLAFHGDLRWVDLETVRRAFCRNDGE